MGSGLGCPPRSLNHLMLTIVVSEKRSLCSVQTQNYSEHKALFAMVDKHSVCNPGLPYPEEAPREVMVITFRASNCFPPCNVAKPGSPASGPMSRCDSRRDRAFQ